MVAITWFTLLLFPLHEIVWWLKEDIWTLKVLKFFFDTFEKNNKYSGIFRWVVSASDTGLCCDSLKTRSIPVQDLSAASKESSHVLKGDRAGFRGGHRGRHPSAPQRRLVVHASCKWSIGSLPILDALKKQPTQQLAKLREYVNTGGPTLLYQESCCSSSIRQVVNPRHDWVCFKLGRLLFKQVFFPLTWEVVFTLAKANLRPRCNETTQRIGWCQENQNVSETSGPPRQHLALRLNWGLGLESLVVAVTVNQTITKRQGHWQHNQLMPLMIYLSRQYIRLLPFWISNSCVHCSIFRVRWIDWIWHVSILILIFKHVDWCTMSLVSI